MAEEKYEIAEDGLVREIVGEWAQEKHDLLRGYIGITRSVRRKFLSGNSACASYIDLFCGPGQSRIRDTGTVIDGSPVAAFSMAKDGGQPFSDVHIADNDDRMVAAASERIRRLLTKTLPTLSNVWLGTSVESLDYLNRIETLRDVKAHVRFISFEPLLSSVGKPNLKGIDWAIVGGESGPGCRPMNPVWVEEIHQACEKHDTAFFFKQWGGKRKKAAGRTLHGRTYDELPLVSIPPN